MANVGDQRPEDGPKESSSQLEQSSQGIQTETDEVGHSIPEEVLQAVPREHRQAVVRAITSITQFAGPALNPLFQRLTSEHVSKIIDNRENQSVREHGADGSRRNYQFAYFLVGGTVAVGLIVFFTLTDNRDLLPPIVTGITGFLGGLAVGQRFRS